jgi:hypothetical protein
VEFEKSLDHFHVRVSLSLTSIGLKGLFGICFILLFHLAMQHGDGLFEKARGDRTNKLRHSLSLHHGAELVVAVHPFSPGNFVLFKKVSCHAEFPDKTAK